MAAVIKFKNLLIIWFLTTIPVLMNAQQKNNGHYVKVNGLNMYYEMHGAGHPIVLLHGGGSTINSNFGRIIPALAQKYLVIAVELQAHGRTKDIDRALSFEQDADDVAALLQQLKVVNADILGFSNGGTTTLQIAIRHPQLVNRIILASTLFQRNGMQPGFFEGMASASIEQMPPPLKKAYFEVNPDETGFHKMFNRDVARMVAFKDIADTSIKTIRAKALVINGDAEVVLAEHALRLSRLLPGARLLILPSAHGDYLGEICTPQPDDQQIQFVVNSIISFLTPNK